MHLNSHLLRNEVFCLNQPLKIAQETKGENPKCDSLTYIAWAYIYTHIRGIREVCVPLYFSNEYEKRKENTSRRMVPKGGHRGHCGLFCFFWLKKINFISLIS